MTFRYLIILGIALLFLVVWIFIRKPASSIDTVHSPLEVNWDAVTKDTLVVFDIDDVLVMPSDAIYQTTEHNKALRKKLFDALAAQFGMSEVSILQRKSLYLKRGKKKLIEPKVAQIIHRLQAKGIKIIGLSNSPTGPFGCIPRMEEWRVDSLRSLGIDFSASFSEHSFHRFVLEGFLGTNGEYPVFKDGLLITNGISKGKVLSAFWDYLSWMPREIVFIDDSMTYLQDVQAATLEKGIAFKGFHDLEAGERSAQADERIAALQIKHLVEKQDWLSDEEAEKKLSEGDP